MIKIASRNFFRQISFQSILCRSLFCDSSNNKRGQNTTNTESSSTAYQSGIDRYQRQQSKQPYQSRNSSPNYSNQSPSSNQNQPLQKRYGQPQRQQPQFQQQQQDQSSQYGGQQQENDKLRYFNISKMIRYQCQENENFNQQVIELVQFINDSNSYSHRNDNRQFDSFLKALQNDISNNNNQMQKGQNSDMSDISKEIDLYWRILVTSRQIKPLTLEQSAMSELSKRIVKTSNPKQLLCTLIGVSLQQIRTFKVKSIYEQYHISIESIIQRTLSTVIKFNLLDIVCYDINYCKDKILEEYVQFVYDFYSYKIFQKEDEYTLKKFYSLLLEELTDLETDPSFEFSLINISLLSEIKQKSKSLYQSLKVQHSNYFRRCFSAILQNTGKIEDFQWVFLLYKLAIIDHSSFGVSFEKFWIDQERRMISKLKQLSLVQKKSLLYSIGKQQTVSSEAKQLFNLLVNDKEQLLKERYLPKFMEYYANLFLSGIGRLLINKEQIIAALPMIYDLLNDPKISKVDKMEFVNTVSTSFYRIGVYDQNFWNEFFKYSNEMLNNPQRLFNCYLISSTCPAFEKEIQSGNFVEQMKLLEKKIKSLPNYNQMIQKIILHTTQTRQSLFEQRFNYSLNSFGKPFIQEHIINNIFAVDFFLPEEKIAIEIQGYQHFIKMEDGSFRNSIPTEFKIKYFEKIGIKVIQIGVHEYTSQSQPQISTLRSFLLQYRKITQ